MSRTQASRAAAPFTLEGHGYVVQVEGDGGLHVEVDGERYTVESFYSYPASPIGTHALGRRLRRGGWSVRVEADGIGGVRLEAAGDHYRLVRTVACEGHRVRVSEVLCTAGPDDVAVLISHRVRAEAGAREIRIGGAGNPSAEPGAVPRPCAAVEDGRVQWPATPSRHLTAENPTLFLAGRGSGLGLLAEDSISRLQFCGAVHQGCAVCSLCRFALQPGVSRTLRWVLYPLGPGQGYFDFVNQVRRDWGTNFRMPGPWGFFDVVHHRELLADPPRLQAYLQRKRLGVAALVPWLDYDNYNALTGRAMDRGEYRDLMQRAARALKAADPGIRCTGCMEGNIVGLPQEAAQALHDLLPPQRRRNGYPIPFTPEQEAILRALPLRWRDCLYIGPDERPAYELYYRGPHAHDPSGRRNAQDPRRVPMMALMVYAAPGNDQLTYWLDQARFLLEEVGLDGIYIDQFSLAFTELQRFSYAGWDGLTVDIDAATGAVARRCTDGAWVGRQARRELIEYVLSQGKVMVANSAAAVEEVQALPVTRFMEAEFSGHALDWTEGRKPPLRAYPCKGHLGSPVALGSRPEMGGEAGTAIYARYIMRTAVDYLRHGLLFYHYVTEIPESGPGSGEYGALNHMFPFTPIRLQEGWVEGQERTVTAVTGQYAWPHPGRPAVRRFGPEGRAVERPVGVSESSAGWQVDLELRDWTEIAVIEGAAPPP
ncbi:MAG: hypothetical protein AB1505_05755 [Candidatus Latescibacterota bacterium]